MCDGFINGNITAHSCSFIDENSLGLPNLKYKSLLHILHLVSLLFYFFFVCEFFCYSNWLTIDAMLFWIQYICWTIRFYSFVFILLILMIKSVGVLLCKNVCLVFFRSNFNRMMHLMTNNDLLSLFFLSTFYWQVICLNTFIHHGKHRNIHCHLLYILKTICLFAITLSILAYTSISSNNCEYSQNRYALFFRSIISVLLYVFPWYFNHFLCFYHFCIEFNFCFKVFLHIFWLSFFASHFLLDIFLYIFFVIQISSINNRRYRSFSELSYSFKGKNNSTKTLNLESHFMSASTHESYEKDIQKLKNHLTSLIVISTNFLLHCHIDEFYVIFHSKCPSCVYLKKSINFFLENKIRF